MNLTAEQVAAAEAAGCRFVPVPPDGPHRYAMQRKLFRVGGEDRLATRGGGLYETAATLDRLILEGRALLPAAMPAPPEDAPAAEAAAPPVAQRMRSAPEDVLAPDSAPEEVPSPAIAPEEVLPEVLPPDIAPAAAEAVPAEPVLARPGRRRRAPAAPKDPPPATGAAADEGRPEATRARRPAEAPRWATAGAARRGRSEQHWSKRGR